MQADTTLDRLCYESRFAQWHDRASVRTKPRRVVDEPDSLLYFTPELLPLAAHPLVRGRGDQVVRDLLLRRLYIYLDFTAGLEQQLVNPACAAISRSATAFSFPDRMREDAYKIYTDEAWHAQFSDDLLRQLQAHTGKPAILPPVPEFFTRLRVLDDGPLADEPHLKALICAIVSETLISSTLSGMPRDQRLARSVREVIADHAIDEGVHHAYFASVLEHLWHQLNPRQRRLAAEAMPKAIRAFLEPDLQALVTVLVTLGFSSDETAQIMAECYASDEVDASVRRDARACLRHMAHVGVLDEAGALEALEASRLCEPGSA